jgi:hypothetical protein
VARVVRFPPLPTIPEPEEAAADDRQKKFAQILGNIAGSLSDGVTVINTGTGFRASAVDLGFLQEMLGLAIKTFDMTAVRERWEDDLRPWFVEALMTWIQRCKELRFELNEYGVRVEIDTQDDCGYYRYEFAVFPGRKE